MKETQTYKNMVNMVGNNFPVEVFTHHSGGTDANPLADTSSHTAKGMESWHLQKGWDGLGYQYVIHDDGIIWKGRPEHRNGAHVKGHNTTSIGICLSGNFDATLPTEAQIKSLKWLLKDILSRYPNIKVTDIKPHRSAANKTCHGRLLPDDWAQKLLQEDQMNVCPLALKDANRDQVINRLIEFFK